MRLPKVRLPHEPQWARNHPALLALIVFVLAVIPGFYSADQANRGLEAEVTRAQAQNACLLDYSTQLAAALNDRDGVNLVARGEAQELWKKLGRLTGNPAPDARQRFLDAIDRYVRILNQLDKTTRLNPYPDPSACFAPTGQNPNVRLMSAASDPGKPGHWDDLCWGSRVTIYATYQSDVIIGTDGDDVIFGYSGDDVIVAGKGNDKVCSRWGEDIVNAGQGHDRVNCGGDRDTTQKAEEIRQCED